MRPETMAKAGLALLVAVLVVLGLFAVGGPGQGRLERHDRIRMNDLQAIERYLRCVADAEGRLPATLEMGETCRRDLRVTDPYSGVGYRYERVSDTAWRLCAAFDLPERMGHRVDFDTDSGCLSGSFPG